MLLTMPAFYYDIITISFEIMIFLDEHYFVCAIYQMASLWVVVAWQTLPEKSLFPLQLQFYQQLLNLNRLSVINLKWFTINYLLSVARISLFIHLWNPSLSLEALKLRKFHFTICFAVNVCTFLVFSLVISLLFFARVRRMKKTYVWTNIHHNYFAGRFRMCIGHLLIFWNMQKLNTNCPKIEVLMLIHHYIFEKKIMHIITSEKTKTLPLFKKLKIERSKFQWRKRTSRRSTLATELRTWGWIR